MVCLGKLAFVYISCQAGVRFNKAFVTQERPQCQWLCERYGAARGARLFPRMPCSYCSMGAPRWVRLGSNATARGCIAVVVSTVMRLV